MAAILIWLITIGVGLVLLVVTAALKKLAFEAFVCALISINFAILALREHEPPVMSRRQQLSLLATNAGYLGFNWLWMSLAIIVLHLPKIRLDGAMGFATGGLAAATLCLCFARLIEKAAAEQPERIESFLRLAGFMALVQLIGAFVTLTVLIAHSVNASARFDWPSLNVIAFSTVALAIISARALLTLLMGVTQVQQLHRVTRRAGPTGATRPQPVNALAPADRKTA